MAALEFPSAPTVGQHYFAANGVIYIWDGEVWGGSAAPSTTAAGGDLTGTYPAPLIAAGAVGDAEISDVAWTKVTGAPPSMSAAMLANVTPTGTRPTTAFTVPQLAGADPVAILAVLNGLVLDQVGSPAANDECSLVGTTLTTVRTITSTDKLKVFLWY
jgi:hypothetical protein